MFMHFGFMMQPTNYPAFLSVGMFPQIMLTLEIFFYFIFREYAMFSLRLSSYSDPKIIPTVNVNLSSAAVSMCHLQLFAVLKVQGGNFHFRIHFVKSAYVAHSIHLQLW